MLSLYVHIFQVKIFKAYIFFKNSRYWKDIRQYKIDKAVHRVSDTFNLDTLIDFIDCRYGEVVETNKELMCYYVSK